VLVVLIGATLRFTPLAAALSFVPPSTWCGAPLPQQWRPCPNRHNRPASQHREFSTNRLGASVAFERSQQHDFSDSREVAMLWTIAVILLVLWALGMITSYTVGGVVHLLLVIALVVILFQFIGGRRSI
jgi:hypothetical protein